jgi:hypothetical protein
MNTRNQYRALLDRAQGYITQARRRLPIRRTPDIALRSGNLARAISARYALLEQRWPLMAFIFEQPERSSVTVSNAYHTTHPSIFMNPRVVLRMLVSHREEARRAVADPMLIQPFNRASAPITFAASSGQKQRLQEEDEVLERIIRRAVREEHPLKAKVRSTEFTSVRADQAAPEKNAASLRLPPLARVFRHAPRANAEATAKAKNDVSVVAADSRIERARPSAAATREIIAAAAVQTPVDITRITDQVMRALDRRIVAQRERIGRG